MKKDIRITVRLEDREYKELEKIAKKDDRTISWLIRTAINKLIVFSKRKGSL